MLKFKVGTMTDISKSKSVLISSVIKTDNSESRYINNDPDVVSEVPYDLDKSESNKFVEGKLFYKSTHIKLAMPIVNVFTAGVRLDAISKIVPEEYSVYSLSKGTWILDISDESNPRCISPSMISNTEVYNPYKHLIGGSAIKYLLDRVNIDYEIISYLENVCNKFFTVKEKEKTPNKSVGTIAVGNGDVWIIENYYINVSSLDLLQKMESVADEIRDKLLVGDNKKGIFLPRITVLLSFRNNPQIFKDMVQDFLAILPLGFRPTINKAKDPLSTLYNRVVQANIELKNSLLTTGSRLDVIRLKYVNLYRKYLNLTVEKSAMDTDKFKPLVDILTGKYAVIRENVQSVTIDNSGRSVITIDPEMSIDTVGIPEGMAVNLCERELLKDFKYNNKNKAIMFDPKYKASLTERARKILDGSYVSLGRQPTLFMLGLQGFKVKVIKGKSIRLNPLCTSAYNADFDGDQMHVSRAQSEKAQEEIKNLMANVNNIFYPRNGLCHISPRQEMIYGLYKCYKAIGDESSREYIYNSVKEFKDKVINDLKMQNVIIDDKCIIDNIHYKSIGYACLKMFLGGTELQKVRLGVIPITTDTNYKEECVTEDFYKELFKHIKLNYSTDLFIKVVNKIVLLGFTVSNLYAPDVGVLKQIDTSSIIKEFERKVESVEKQYNLGFIAEESYNMFYSTEYNELESKILKKVISELGEGNGYIDLIKSGARGSKSNLLQLFGMKGTVLKNQVEAFNAIIKSPLSEGLTGFEHFVSACGAREGIVDKVIRTFAPGYLSRRAVHVSRHLSIVSDDCGTTDGLLLTYDFIKEMYGIANLSGIDSFDCITLKEYAVSILETRYVVGSDIVLDKNTAEQIFDKSIAFIDNNSLVKLEGVKLRSPLTCKDQCCSKCYGLDLLTWRKAVKGTPVGTIAGPTIGEPVTQLIMKNFQRGGIAGVKNLTSSFDTLTDLFELYSVSKGTSKEVPIVHDYITPVEGYIKLVPRGTDIVQLNIVDEKGNNKLREKVYIYNSVKLKEYVEVGDSIYFTPGILDVNEILKYRGVDKAQMYLLFQSYNIFKNEIPVNFKYFEVLVNGMTMFICTKGNNTFKVGNYYSMIEHTTGDKTDCQFIKVLRGLKQVPKVRTDTLTSVYLEDVSKVITRNAITSGEDSLKDPFVRISLGLPAGIGTADENYMKDRGK